VFAPISRAWSLATGSHLCGNSAVAGRLAPACYRCCGFELDNLTNKLFPIRRVDKLVVEFDDEARGHELHGYEPDEISVAGPPQFDGYFQVSRACLGKSSAGSSVLTRRVGSWR
jgi:hypothetical protein